jgi:dTDP-4-dehydrorhamnose 3,5-epimerase
VVEIHRLALEGLIELRPRQFEDERGFLSEVWSRPALQELGIKIDFVQENHSYSASQGTLRGLHLQRPPGAQDKLVRVSRGAIYDVAVDVRRDSPTFRRWAGLILSAELWNQLLIPKGFAHGFLTLTPEVEVQYTVSELYRPDLELSIRYDDPLIGIQWPSLAAPLTLSDKDRDAPLLADVDTGF